MLFEALKDIRINGKDIKEGETFSLVWDRVKFKTDPWFGSQIYACPDRNSEIDIRDFKAVKPETVEDIEVLIRETDNLKNRKVLFTKQNRLSVTGRDIYYLDGEVPVSLGSDNPKSIAFRTVFFDFMLNAAFDIEGVEAFEWKYVDGKSYLYRIMENNTERLVGTYYSGISLINAFNS